MNRSHRSLLLALLLFGAVLALGMQSQSPLPIPSAAPNLKAQAGPSGIVGATIGTYGLIDPSALQSHAPINIDGNASWTTANGVRYGAGTQSNPYVVANWTIDMTGYPSSTAGIAIHHTTRFAIIKNVKVINCALSENSNYFNILLGTASYPPVKTDYVRNVTVTRNLVTGNGCYGIQSSYFTRNNTISYNDVAIGSSFRNWRYGITCQGGTANCVIRGNYVNIPSIATGFQFRTVGLQAGDGCQIDWGIGYILPCATVSVSYNTVTNATIEGIVSDGTTKSSFYNNLIVQQCTTPAGLCVNGRNQGTWTSRGIMYESRTNFSLVHDNIFKNYNHGIEAGGWAGWNWNNSLINNDYGFYLNANSSFQNVQFTDFNVFWNNYFQGSISGNYFIPSGGTSATNQYTTNFDITSTPTTTSFPISFTNQPNRGLSRVRYSWVGTNLNISYNISANGVNLPAVTVYYHATVTSQSLDCQWYGSTVTVSVSKFTRDNVTFTPTYTGTSRMACSLLQLSSYYLVKRNWATQANISTSSTGYWDAAISGPFTVVYGLIFQGVFSPPSNVAPSLTVPAASTYSVFRSFPPVNLSVKYSDANGDAPAYVRVEVSTGPVTNVTLQQNVSTSDYTVPVGFSKNFNVSTFCPAAYSFFFSTSDGTASIRNTPSKTLTILNTVPRINQVAGIDVPLSASPSASYIVPLSASDVDIPGCQTLTWSLVTGASWLLIGSANGTLYGTAALGTFSVSARASDGTGIGYLNYTLVVSETGGVVRIDAGTCYQTQGTGTSFCFLNTYFFSAFAVATDKVTINGSITLFGDTWPNTNNITVNFTAFNPRVSAASAYRRALAFDATAPAGTIAFFRFGGLVAGATYALYVDGQPYIQVNSGNGNLSFAWGTWSTHTFILEIMGSSTGGGGTPPGTPPGTPTIPGPPNLFQFPNFRLTLNLGALAVGIVILVVGAILVARGPKPWGAYIGILVLVLGLFIIAAPMAGWKIGL